MKNIKILITAALLIVLVLAIGFILFGRNPVKIDKAHRMEIIKMADLSVQERQQTGQKLATKKIFFAHMSVGYNILDGFKQIAEKYPELKLNIIETDNPDEMTAPGLYHFRLGHNADPLKKNESFSTLIEKIHSANLDMAFMKFCYVDFYAGKDTNSIFQSYTQTVENLQKKSPSVRFLWSKTTGWA